MPTEIYHPYQTYHRCHLLTWGTLKAQGPNSRDGVRSLLLILLKNPSF
jgi:hypothetical protein